MFVLQSITSIKYISILIYVYVRTKSIITNKILYLCNLFRITLHDQLFKAVKRNHDMLIII